MCCFLCAQTIIKILRFGGENNLTHVLTHTGIGNNGENSIKWNCDLRDLPKSGLKRAKKYRISRSFRSDRSS